MDDLVDYNRLGYLPSEIELAQTFQDEFEDFRKVAKYYKKASTDEALQVLEREDHPEFFEALADLIKLGDFENEANQDSLMPEEVRQTKSKLPKAVAHTLSVRQLFFRDITAQLANAVQSELSKEDETTNVGTLGKFEIKMGTRKEWMRKICWYSFILGNRSQIQKQHTEFLRKLPILFHGMSMDRSRSTEQKQPPGALSKNQELKSWIRSIILGFREATSEMPSKQQLKGFVRNQIGAQKGLSPPVAITTSNKGMERVKHRKDQGKGVSFSTISDTWLREIRKDILG